MAVSREVLTTAAIQSAPERYSRRDIVRLGAGTALAMLAGASLAEPALAGRTWRRRDPVFAVDGSIFHVIVAVEDLGKMTSDQPVTVNIRVPVGSVTEFISMDDGCGNGYLVSFSEDAGLRAGSGHDVRVDVFIPNPTPVPVYAELTDANETVVASKLKSTDQWLTLKGRI